MPQATWTGFRTFSSRRWRRESDRGDGVAGIPEVLRAGEEGLLVPEKDPAGIADAVEELMRSDELRRRLGRAARKRVEEDLSWKNAGEKFESVLRSVAEARRP
jgi:glycosyltransferase involved in cell wall biosynthesis